MIRRIRSVARFSLPEVLTVGHAFAWLVVVEILLRRTSLPRLARWLGVNLDVDSAPSTPQTGAPPQLPARAERQLWAAFGLADRWPYSDGPCLRRSLVAARLIRRHDPVLRLGVAPQDDGIFAHAWLEIDGHPLEDLGDLLAFTNHAAFDTSSVPTTSEPGADR